MVVSFWRRRGEYDGTADTTAADTATATSATAGTTGVPAAEDPRIAAAGGGRRRTGKPPAKCEALPSQGEDDWTRIGKQAQYGSRLGGKEAQRSTDSCSSCFSSSSRSYGTFSFKNSGKFEFIGQSTASQGQGEEAQRKEEDDGEASRKTKEEGLCGMFFWLKIEWKIVDLGFG